MSSVITTHPKRKEIEKAFQKAKSDMIELAKEKKQVVITLAKRLNSIGIEKDKVASLISNELSRDGFASKQWVYKVLPPEYVDKEKEQEPEIIMEGVTAEAKDVGMGGQVLLTQPKPDPSEPYVEDNVISRPSSVKEYVSKEIDNMKDGKIKELESNIDQFSKKIEGLRESFSSKVSLSHKDQELPMIATAYPATRKIVIEWDKEALKRMK